MRADAGLHADPTRRQIGEPSLHLATRPFLPQHDGTALILANDVACQEGMSSESPEPLVGRLGAPAQRRHRV